MQEPKTCIAGRCLPLSNLRLKNGKTVGESLLSHRIIEWVELKGSFKDHLVQIPCHGQGCLSLDQVTQSLVQPDLEQFSDTQPVPMSHHL